MLRLERNIRYRIIYGIGYAAAGLIIMLLVFLFSLIILHQSLTLSNISDLYRNNNAFYLLNIIPLISGIYGITIGMKIVRIKDEVDKIKNSYEGTINRTVEFTRRIEMRDLSTSFVPFNGEKVLESAMESMRKSLISFTDKEIERNEINRISRETSALLQSFNDINLLADETIAFLVNKIDKVVQGAFYIVEGETDPDKVLKMRSSFAYKRKKHLKAEFKFAEGLVGQAAIEKRSILRTEIPDDYLTISSGLIGEKKPKCLFISPFLANDEVYGAVELASFQKLTSSQCELIEELCKIIARTIANLKASQRTILLLEESEKMSSELNAQKKLLMRNADEIMKAQQELKRTNRKLEEQIQEVHNTNKRTQILLENANEVITIFSEERKIIYVSPSVKSIMGYYPEELFGKDHTENVHPLDTDRFKQLLSDLRSYPEQVLSLQYRYFTKSGDVLWLEATGKNLLADEVIKGYVINSSDISERRLAEKEQRIRAKMQALSENSSDLIIRIDIFSRCTYINPVIEEYTGIKKDFYVNKPITATEMDASVVTVLKKLLDEASVDKAKKTAEMVFPTPAGNQVMHINAIPEINESGEVESVLFACHNITEAKSREELIRKKNKNINDSINYAYNIQSALMPVESDFRRLLPNSFMFYKPKDIVSGDYPWLIKYDNTVFIGAMDCTGHGVPGALMSIIGFFLQSAILNQNRHLNAGEVLTQLHTSVVKTLKQEDANSKINDGMDAAFCKIDLKKRELEYAGAHRPLYFVSNNTLVEIKGDKFPVGSSQYRNRKDFTNNKLKIKSGDAIYFMTDGYHDQFGGPTGKERFTSDRVVRLIRDNTHLSIFQMGTLMRNSYEEWKGNIPQLDDVLVIGLKF